jgi:hypothetical protein
VHLVGFITEIVSRIVKFGVYILDLTCDMLCFLNKSLHSHF